MTTCSRFVIVSAFGLSLSAAGFGQTVERPQRAVVDPGVVTTRQAITPAGVPTVFQGRVYGVAWASADELWVLHATEVYRLDWKTNRVVSRVAHGGTPGIQSIRAVGDAVLVGRSSRDGGNTARAGLALSDGRSTKPVATGLGQFQAGAIGVSGDASGRRLAAVPLVYENKLAVIDVSAGKVLQQAETGIAPFAAVISAKGDAAYVSNLGGRPPKANELFGSPMQKPDEKITVDARGVASTGTVMRVDTASGKVTHTIPVGLHPTALAWDEARGRLYVANGNSESVSVIDTAKNVVLRSIALQPFADRVKGIAPTALAVTGDGKRLYVACGGINAVAVIDTATGKVDGLIPTGWYPNHLALDAGGKNLAVTSLLGPGSGWRDAPAKRFVHAHRGSVAVIAMPDAAQLASYTTAVAENNRLRLAGAAPDRLTARAGMKPVAIPVRSGEPSLIEHVVYIIKENRTYDQVLGDLKKGNGDPSLVMFGEEVTPNQHRLADQFVVLDNLYATGGNSADGHQWVTQANEVEYCLWPGYQGRSYPFDGTDPMAYSSGGFLWDYALARGRTVKVYGEYAGRMGGSARGRTEMLQRWKKGADFTKEFQTRAPLEPLNKILASNFPAYTTMVPDVVRAQIFLADLKKMESEGKFPNLVLLQLPSNHTNGTTPGISSAKAMVADNDLAVGQIVEALSKSKFWPKMAIFVVEDDAQNGVDHVDGHRTTAFLASPYARRGAIDSTFYSHQSILKTIELILGLPTMSLFDLIAHDMRLSFQNEPDLTPYEAVPPRQDLFEINPPQSALRGAAKKAARDSTRMDFSKPDAAPTERLNRILWGAIRGWETPYPAPKNAVFAPLSLDLEDEEREVRGRR
ncbi:MAG: bifunctional YncE family protein/alkaline phosphatase family protein [Acidobacteria bacterium]|nr:bifunctional YncE family protein/alkaline phosphatase family protein [Acidobacteriota bacterium]